MLFNSNSTVCYVTLFNNYNSLLLPIMESLTKDRISFTINNY